MRFAFDVLMFGCVMSDGVRYCCAMYRYVMDSGAWLYDYIAGGLLTCSCMIHNCVVYIEWFICLLDDVWCVERCMIVRGMFCGVRS